MREEIIEIIRDSCALEEDGIAAETKLNEISLDSLSFLGALVRIEERFGFEFDIEELDLYGWETVGDIILKAEEMRDAKV